MRKILRFLPVILLISFAAPAGAQRVVIAKDDLSCIKVLKGRRRLACWGEDLGSIAGKLRDGAMFRKINAAAAITKERKKIAALNNLFRRQRSESIGARLQRMRRSLSELLRARRICGSSKPKCESSSSAPIQSSVSSRSSLSHDGSSSVSSTVSISSSRSSGAPSSGSSASSGSPQRFRISATALSGGTISPNGTIYVNGGDDITFRITPASGYVVSDVRATGVSVGAEDSHSFYRVSADDSIEVEFVPQADAVPETLYVDKNITANCPGTYSIVARNCSGGDGKAYKTIVEAANVAGPGDAVLIRAGVYNASGSSANDVLWPKHSGTPDRPIVFKNYNGEQVVLGEGASSYPSDYRLSIARAVISLKNVHDIIIEGMRVHSVAGWLFARGCRGIILRNNVFESALWDSKGTARFVSSDHNRIINNTFIGQAFDSLQLNASNFNLVEGNTFYIASHSLLAIRCGNFNVIRDNYFSNPWYQNGLAEKLTEVYDCKVDTRGAANPAYVDPPQYDHTAHNLFEGNTFGYHPDYAPSLGKGSRTSAIQFSGQDTIIRQNIFSNPTGRTNADYPDGYAGGIAIAMRWGGSWEGWSPTKKMIIGEGHEAGFVHGNRIYSNIFNGYDGGKLIFPADNAMRDLPAFAPMKNVENFADYPFAHTWKFEDNVLKNNAFIEGRFLKRNSWATSSLLDGAPLQLLFNGNLTSTIFEHNNFFASGPREDELIYYHVAYPYQPAKDAVFFNLNWPQNFRGNHGVAPGFISVPDENFNLASGSSLIDAGAFLTRTANGDSGVEIPVEDVRYFYDGFGIQGEIGDQIRLAGSSQIARIAGIDYARNVLTLDRALSWSAGQGVSLHYEGAAPDIGAYEHP